MVGVMPVYGLHMTTSWSVSLYPTKECDKCEMIPTSGVTDTQFGVPPFKSLNLLIPVKLTMVSMNAGCWGPPYIASG